MKRKLLVYSCNASIYFNRQCLKRNLTPSYAKITIPNTSPAHSHTQRKMGNIRVRDEIKYLRFKKQLLNTLIYNLHLTLANTWDRLSLHICHDIEDKLQKVVREDTRP